jgi:hypothetical protein
MEGSGEFKNSKDGFFGKRGTNSISPPKNEEQVKIGNQGKGRASSAMTALTADTKYGQSVGTTNFPPAHQ